MSLISGDGNLVCCLSGTHNRAPIEIAPLLASIKCGGINRY